MTVKADRMRTPNTPSAAGQCCDDLTFTGPTGTHRVDRLLARVDAVAGPDHVRALARDYTSGRSDERSVRRRERAARELSALARQVFGPGVGTGRAAADVLVRLLAVSGRVPPLPGWR